MLKFYVCTGEHVIYLCNRGSLGSAIGVKQTKKCYNCSESLFKKDYQAERWHRVLLLPCLLPSLLNPVGFPLPYLLPATTDLLLAISPLNWEKLSGCSKAQKKKLLSQSTNLQTQGYPMIVFVTPTFISKLMLCLFTSYLCICWGVGIPVFLCLSIFQQKKVAQRTWALIAFGSAAEILMYPPASFEVGSQALSWPES